MERLTVSSVEAPSLVNTSCRSSFLLSMRSTVDADDRVAGPQAAGLGGRAGRHVCDYHRLEQGVLRQRIESREDEDGHHEVDRDTGAQHDDPLEHALRGEAALVGGVFLAHHLDKAAQRYEVEGIGRLAAAEPEESRGKAEPELRDLYAEPLGREEVAHLVNEYHERQDGNHGEPCR